MQALAKTHKKKSSSVIGCAVGIVIVGPFLWSLVCILLVPTLIAAFSSSLTSAFLPSWGVASQEDNAVTQAAKEIASYLRNCHGMTSQNALDNGCALFPSRYAAFDPAFLDTPYAQWGQQHCPGCETWANGSFQCVSFVLAAYSQFHPLDFSGNGNMFDTLYATQKARDLGYVHIATGGQNLPISPGDIPICRGGGKSCRPLAKKDHFMGEKIPLERIDDTRWRIPLRFNEKMHVPGIIYANDQLIEHILIPSCVQSCQSLTAPCRSSRPSVGACAR